MASPVISSVTPSPAVVQPGGTSNITVSATDPDSGSVTLTATVRDSAGNTTTGSGVIQVADTLTYSMTATRGTVTQDATNPALFHWTDA